LKEIRLNAFVMDSVTHSHQGLWRHPRDHSLDYCDLGYWTDFAQLLERGLFDGVFMADALGVYDVYGGSADASLRSAVMVPRNDPAMLVSAMAACTRHLGFGITFSVLDETPYAFARKISTLDHFTKGRIGWNVVTGFLESAARARGDDRQMSHDERYAVAEEFMEVVYRLWEESWEDGAVLRDTARGVYADPARIHAIRHEGQYFKLDGIHMCEPSPQRTPLLYQAGSSPKGIGFAARHAEAVFMTGPRHAVAPRVRRLREEAARQGRDPQSIQVMPSMNIVTAATDAEAEDLHAEYVGYLDRDGALARLSGFTGTDLAALAPDQPITASGSGNGIQSTLENLVKGGATGKAWTVGDVANSLNPDGAQPVLVGGPKRVADALEAWLEEADVDGFNIAVAVKPETIANIVAHVVPELQRRGLYKTAYRPGTLREKLFGQGARSRPGHPSAAFRKG
jgi:FMN-dependent oxidoreductase (nitrilotriacetate monooxygenase family)